MEGSSNLKNMKSYSLLFQTAGDIPPPHAFHTFIKLEVKNSNVLFTEFKQEYIDRNEIPVDEIEAEGFTENDDFSWQGALPFFWMEEMERILEKSEWKEATNSQVLLLDPVGTDFLSPVSERQWISFTEELIQACLEEGGKELPMEMTLGQLEKSNFFEKVRLEWSFSRREVLAQAVGGSQAKFAFLEWEEGQSQLKDWIEMEASEKDLYQLPKSKGWYWLLNNEIWIPYSKEKSGKIWEWVDRQVSKV